MVGLHDLVRYVEAQAEAGQPLVGVAAYCLDNPGAPVVFLAIMGIVGSFILGKLCAVRASGISMFASALPLASFLLPNSNQSIGFPDARDVFGWPKFLAACSLPMATVVQQH